MRIGDIVEGQRAYIVPIDRYGTFCKRVAYDEMVFLVADLSCWVTVKVGDVMPMEPKLVHVYAQQQYHDDCWIVANKAGLIALRDAINKALEPMLAPPQPPDSPASNRDPATSGMANAEVMTSDGEGYHVKVRLDDSPWDEGDHWLKLALPYIDHETTGIKQAVEHGAIWPWQRWA